MFAITVNDRQATYAPIGHRDAYSTNPSHYLHGVCRDYTMNLTRAV